MKKIIAIILAFIICLSLCSCAINITSIEGLMRPPKLSGESSLLQLAFEESVADINGVMMKTPISGENRSSYLFFDLENDGIKEAIVFYSEPINEPFACANVFKLVDNKWTFISKIKGKGEEVYEVNFADINNDNVLEILLSWTGVLPVEKVNSSDFGSSNNRVLTIYNCDGVTTTLLKTETYTNLFLDDLNNDLGSEIVLFRINLSDLEKRTTAQILSFNKDYSIKSNDILVLSGLLEINNIITDTIEVKDDKHTRIYVDGAVSEIGVITEVIDVSHSSFKITLPLYEQNQSQHPPTLRDSRVLSCDIDNDGVIEIPTVEILQYGGRITENSSERKELNLTVWSELTEKQINVDFKCLLNTSYSYMFVFPDDSANNLTAIYDDNNLTLTYYSHMNGSLNKEIFSIKVFLEEDWDENHHNYTKLNENEMFVYGYMIMDDDDEFYREYINDNFVVIK